MIIGMPAVMAGALFLGWRKTDRNRQAILLALGASFTLALSIPALSAINWNSGCSGMMRYAFWAGMPLVFVLLQRLREWSRWPAAALTAIFAIQFSCMVTAQQYSIVEFSPAARWALQRAPAWYNPDPEIFFERLVHEERRMDPSQLYVFSVDGQASKTLFHSSSLASQQLCGPGSALSDASGIVQAGQGWAYLNGPAACHANNQ